MTAVTRAGTLSRVIISWGGTSMVTVLRSILTILSIRGRRMKSPGPLGPPWTRPILNITPRSYSFTTLMALSMTATMNIATITTRIAPIPNPTACSKPKVAFTRISPLSWALEMPAMAGQLGGHYLYYPSLTKSYHPHLTAHRYRRLTIFLRAYLLRGEGEHGPPKLAVHEDPPRRAYPEGAPYGANLADHPLLAGKCRPPFGGAQRTKDPEEHATHEHRGYHEGAEQYARVGDAGPKERKASGEERHDATRGGQAVVGHAKVCDEECDPNEDQDHPYRRGYHHHRNSAVW